MISKNFIKNSFVYTLAGSLPIASSIILLPLYQAYLPVNEFGALATYTSFSLLIQVVVTYSFDTTLYVYFHEYKIDPKRLAVFISSAFGLMGLIGAGVFLVAIGTGTLLFDSFLAGKNVSFFPYGMLSVITSIFQAFLKVHSSLLQSREKPVLYFWSNLLSFSLIVIFTIAGLMIFPDTLMGPVVGRMIAAGISGAWVLTRILGEFGYSFDFKLLRTTFGFNNISFIYQVQQWLIRALDVFLLGYFFTMDVVGVYDFAFKCLLLIDFVFAGLYNTFYPKVIGIVVAQAKKESTVIINRYFHGIIAVTMMLVCLSILIFPLLVQAKLIKAGYAASLPYVPFLSLIYLTRGIKIYFSLPYGALKYNKPMPVIYLVVSIVKIILMVTFIKQLNVYAVIGSAFVSIVIEILLLRYVIRNKFKFHFNAMKMIIAPLILGIVIVTLELVGTVTELQRHLFYIVFCGLLLAWLYRNELKLMKPLSFMK